MIACSAHSNRPPSHIYSIVYIEGNSSDASRKHFTVKAYTRSNCCWCSITWQLTFLHFNVAHETFEAEYSKVSQYFDSYQFVALSLETKHIPASETIFFGSRCKVHGIARSHFIGIWSWLDILFNILWFRARFGWQIRTWSSQLELQYEFALKYMKLSDDKLEQSDKIKTWVWEKVSNSLKKPTIRWISIKIPPNYDHVKYIRITQIQQIC